MSQLIKKDIATIANKKERAAAKKASTVKYMSPMRYISNAERVPAPIIVGMDNNIEKRAAALLSMPRILAADIVIPEREVPGTNART